MVKVEALEYDGNSAGGEGNRTKRTAWENASDTRVTEFGYDWRNRQTSVKGEAAFYEEYAYDNLGRRTRVDRKDTHGAGTLLAREETQYDPLGRVFQRLRYSVSGGSAGNSLKEKLWYDPAGNVIKRQPEGTRQFEKFQFDAVGRETKRFRCYDVEEDDDDYEAAESVAENTVQEQVEQGYDAAGNVMQVTRRERFHNATSATGELTTPGGAQPKARVYALAGWPSVDQFSSI
jgi:hypothetical protein